MCEYLQYLYEIKIEMSQFNFDIVQILSKSCYVRVTASNA